jgi:uncharacterized repeat protein (TIGR02543 family)
MNVAPDVSDYIYSGQGNVRNQIFYFYRYITISYYTSNSTLIQSYEHVYYKMDNVLETRDQDTGVWEYNDTTTTYSDFNLLTVPTGAPIGYTDYWNSQYNGSGTTYNSGSTYNAGGSTTSFNLFVKRIINSYNLTFDYQGKGTNSTTSQNYNTLLYFPSVTEPAGYTFLGWSKFTTSGTYNIANTHFYMPASNITYYAGWQAKAYGVIFNYNGGALLSYTGTMITYTANSITLSIVYGTVLTFPILFKTGYKLVSWVDETNQNPLTNEITTATITYLYAKNSTYTAVWRPLYTLTFNSNDKGQGKVISNILGASIQLAPTLKAVGYTFNSWHTDKGTLNSAINGGTNYTMPSSNTTLYAKWTDNTQIRLSDLLNTYGNINTGNSTTSISEYQNILGITASTRTSFNTNLKGKGPAPP